MDTTPVTPEAAFIKGDPEAQYKGVVARVEAPADPD
jgi:hypothetical protein